MQMFLLAKIQTFIENDTSVSNIRKFAEAFGATIELEPFER